MKSAIFPRFCVSFSLGKFIVPLWNETTFVRIYFLNNLTSFSSLDHIVTMRVTYSGLVKTRLGGIPRHQACNIRPADYTKCKTTKALQSHERDDFLDT